MCASGSTFFPEQMTGAESSAHSTFFLERRCKRFLARTNLDPASQMILPRSPSAFPIAPAKRHPVAGGESLTHYNAVADIAIWLSRAAVALTFSQAAESSPCRLA